MMIKHNKNFILKMIYTSLIFAIIYLIFSISYFNSIILQNSILSILLVLLSVIISLHLIRIRIIFHRIYIQTIFSTKSKLYTILARGLFVKLITIFTAIFFVLKMLIILCLTNIYIDQYIALYLSVIIFIIIYHNNVEFSFININFLRHDIRSAIKIYFIPLTISLILAFFISIYEVFIDDIYIASNVADIFDKSVETINPSYIYPLRVLLRHIYALDLIIQQLVQFYSPWGYIFYLLVIIFGNILTFFSVILLWIPIKKDFLHENT